MSPAFLQALLGDPASHDKTYGVGVGVVTNNQDPAGLGRVKVKFTWLSDEDESHWARLVVPMAGKDRGIFFLPEVEDEVLVAFEHGAIDRAYILGSLWNSKETPPERNSDGKNNHRTIKSRSGHIIRLDDTTAAEQIEIIDKTGKNKIIIMSNDNKLTIVSESDLSIESRQGTLSLKGLTIEIRSQSSLSVEAAESVDVQASAQLNLKGALVNIN
jgi:uncharacterized protein involved in type VI secretion and phage assembly